MASPRLKQPSLVKFMQARGSLPAPESLVGRRVVKDFFDECTQTLTPFSGTVKRYNKQAKWFHVVYDDGDAEDVELEELHPMLRRAADAAALNTGRAGTAPAASTAPPPASRGKQAKATAAAAAPPKRKSNPGAAAAAKPKPKPKKSATAAPAADDSAESADDADEGAPSTSAAKPAAALVPGAATLGLPAVREKTRYAWPPGREPWRSLPTFLIPVHEQPVLDAASLRALQECKRTYYKRYRQAQADEQERLAVHGQYTEGGKRRAMRPDRVTESALKRGGEAVNQGKVCGHVPGVRPSQRFYSRAEMACLGLHHLPVAGIEYTGASSRAGPGVPPFALSIVVGGWYEDDRDDGAELVYTGQGGNDLLGSRKQVGHQKLEGANAALVGNIQLGLPVRVTRKNKDPHGLYGCVLIYDGLYDVVEYWREVGKEGFGVYKYRMLRRPGQGPLLSEAVSFGGISAPRRLAALARPGVVDPDISGGREAVPVLAVNEAEGGELPPCTALERVPAEEALVGVHRGISPEQLEALRRKGWAPSVEYVTEYRYAPGIKLPPPPVLPARYASDPHAYIRHLNHDRLPYLEGKGGKLVQLREALPVVYECGPWAGCPLGVHCPQAATQRGLSFRLEVFATGDGRGWGVRSLDMIPQHAYICSYFGDVFTAAEYDRMVHTDGHDAAYSMDMALRPDRDWEGNWVEGARTADTAQFVICGLRRRNVAAFFNHSCAPNCFVQPVLAGHHDAAMPQVAIFAGEDVAPFTELTWDYGADYARTLGCVCGAAECISLQEEHDVGSP